MQSKGRLDLTYELHQRRLMRPVLGVFWPDHLIDVAFVVGARECLRFYYPRSAACGRLGHYHWR